ncbi:MAG: hypothetical protein R2834_05215 [Rhodothermales bacterium]
MTALLFCQCDIPTEGPDFEVSTSVRAPLLLEKTFVLLGPDEDGHSPLIDTTAAEFDTLFSVNPSNNVLLIEQELDDFEIGDLNDLVGAIELDPISVDVGIGSLESQTFDTAPFGSPIGLFVTPEIDLGSAPVNSGVSSYPIGSVLVPPSVELISLSDVTVEAVALSSNTSGVNQFTFTLTNGLATATLTDGSGGAPVLVLERPDGGSTLEIARVAFPGTIAAGASRTATMSVASALLTSDTVYRLVIGTNQGSGAIDANPTGVQIATVVAPLEYADTHVSGISAQANIDASGDAISLNSDDADFSGILAAGGDLVITLENSLPIAVTLTDLTVRNLGPVGNLAAPSTMLQLSDLPPGTDVNIPADGTLTLTFPLAGASIANLIDVVVKASSPGIGSSAILSDTDGLFTTVTGVVAVDQLYFTPDSEVFTSNGIIDIDVDDVSFDTGEDYVELQSGTLMIAELANEMDLDFARLAFSLPGFRVAPYTPADSLVITFEGPSENPNGRRYTGLKRGTTRTNIDVDLTGVRIYPSDNQTVYHVYGVSDSGLPSALNIADRIRASIAPEGLEIATVNALMDPISVAMSDDVDGDDKLDLYNNAEANVMDLGSLDSVRDLAIEGLQLNGTELTFSIDTNIGADIIFYAAMVGIKDDGTEVYLQGRNDLAVSASDTMAAQFLVNGSPIAASNLIAFPIPGTPDASETVTRTVRINSENSNLDAFLSSLPKEMRYVGKGIVKGMNGQRVQLQKPFVLNAGLNAGIPVSLAGDATYADVFEIDLSDLDELTDPDNDVQINGASLIITYENGIPLGIEASLEVLDGSDLSLTTLPELDAEAWSLVAAKSDNTGFATDATAGTLEFTITEEQLRTMSAGRKARLRLTLRTNEGQPATLRASDTLKFSVQGRFDLNVPVSFD